MLRDITIGQYYPVDSLLHRLDPRVKLLGTLIFIVSLFFFRYYEGYSSIFFISYTQIHTKEIYGFHNDRHS